MDGIGSGLLNHGQAPKVADFLKTPFAAGRKD